MLFDLIKCHARLFYLQRDRGEDGGVIARPEDFTAAALETVAGMGIEVFTIRGLQSALGLSYYQTRRLLNGYTSRGTPYSGLLEKCPAIGLYGASVTEDGGAGGGSRFAAGSSNSRLMLRSTGPGAEERLSGWTMTRMLTAMTAVFSRVTAVAVNEKTPVKATIPKTPLNMRIFISMITHMYSRIKERRARTRRLALTTGVPLFPKLLSLKMRKSRITSKIGKPRRFFAHSLTAPAVNVLKTAVTLHHR